MNDTRGPVPICIDPYDMGVVEWIHDDDDERVVGCRVRRIGRFFVEIHAVAYTLRVVVTDVVAPMFEGWYSPTGHAWCYPKELGYPMVAAHVWMWDFDPADPGRVNPPGPWIKAVHSQVYREPGIGQKGPE